MVTSRRRTIGVVVLVTLAALVASCTGGSQEPGNDTSTATSEPSRTLPAELTAPLESATEDALAADDVPGAVVVVSVPGEGRWSFVGGTADLDSDGAITDDMTWPLRSITKSFTVTVILQLVDEGLVELDAPVARYVEGVPNGDVVTIRDLAAMTSGLPEYTSDAFIQDFVADPQRAFTPAELLDYAFAEPVPAEPGGEAVYTNTNTVLLGEVIESVTGQSFEVEVSERILEPLGLGGTIVSADEGDWPEPRPTGYQPADGELAPQPTNLSVFGAAGEMLAMPSDLTVWAEALTTGVLLTDETQAERLGAAQPLAQGPEYDAYGLGIGEIEGWWGHTGEGFGFTALAMHQPETGASVVILMNVSGVESGHPPTQLFREIVGILEGG